jgi:hypothetical protein
VKKILAMWDTLTGTTLKPKESPNKHPNQPHKHPNPTKPSKPTRKPDQPTQPYTMCALPFLRQEEAQESP